MINIILNTFGKYHRQDVAMEGLQYLMKRYNGKIQVYDIQFPNTTSLYPNVICKNSLRNTKEIVGGEKNHPFVCDLFNAGLDLSEDTQAQGFIVMNSDVILLPKMLDYLLEKKPKAMAFCRTDIEDVENFEELLTKGAKFVRTEIAGCDIFYFDREWASKFSIFFQSSYLYGKPLFDNVWVGYIKVLGDNSPIGNDIPPYAVHIHHGISSVTTECEEKRWNERILDMNKTDHIVHNIVFYHLKKNLLRRDWGTFLNPTPNEKEFEKEFFDIINIHTENKIP